MRRAYQPPGAADRGVRGLRQAAFAAGRDDLRADQDRPGSLVFGDLAGDLEQRRHLGGGAAAADGLRQLQHRLVLAAQDPPRYGPAGPPAARRAGRSRRDADRRAAVRPARPRCCRQDRGRRRGRGRPWQGPWPPARPAAAADGGGRRGRQPRRLPRRQRGTARRSRHRRLARLCRTRPGRLRPRADQSQPVLGRRGAAAARRSTSSSASPSAGSSAPITARSAPNISRPISTSTCSASTAAPPSASVTVSPGWSSRPSTPNPPPIAASSLRRHRPDGSG